MFDSISIPLSPSLQERYKTLVSEHLSPAQKLAAGLRALPGEASALAATQAAWRFYQNPHASLMQVFEPVSTMVQETVRRNCQRFALVACDWCNLHYASHPSKQDRVALSQSRDLGYELLTGLALSDRDGQPLGPLWMELRAADGVHATHCRQVRPAISVLDELFHNMYYTHQLNLGVTPVFIIDAEADSVAHMRECCRNQWLFLFRADANSSAQYQGRNLKLAAIGEELRAQKAFTLARDVTFQGKKVRQWVAEVPVVLTRPAYPFRKGEKRRAVAGPPIELRLVITELRDQAGNVLAVWYLLTNVPESVNGQEIALWYYWRWQIESYHKLLKSAGQQVEQWQQQKVEAIARRLAVASMACVIVWRLAQDTSPEAAELRKVLVRLSGRQMKRTKPFTAPALLAGFWVLLAMLDILDTCDISTLRALAEHALPWPRPGPKTAST